jgi:hypothetical protein
MLLDVLIPLQLVAVLLVYSALQQSGSAGGSDNHLVDQWDSASPLGE